MVMAHGKHGARHRVLGDGDSSDTAERIDDVFMELVSWAKLALVSNVTFTGVMGDTHPRKPPTGATQKESRAPEGGLDDDRTIDNARFHCENCAMRTKRQQEPESMTDALRRAIVESGESHNKLWKATGVSRASIAKFVTGEQSLRLDLADRLAKHFGLNVVKTD